MDNPLTSIQEAKHAKRLRLTYHASKRSKERDIMAEDVAAALDSSRVEILSNDPSDKNPTCLVLGWDDRDRPIHTWINYAKMLLITIYEPESPRWLTPRERGIR